MISNIYPFLNVKINPKKNWISVPNASTMLVFILAAVNGLFSKKKHLACFGF